MLSRKRFWPWVLAAALTAACSTPTRPIGSGTPATQHLLIAEVYANGTVPDGSDQFIRLYNPTAVLVDLGGWSVGNGAMRAAFPAGARIGPTQGLYVARSGDGFRKEMGAPPDYVWAVPGAGGTPVMAGGAALALGAANGQVVLQDQAGRPVDQVVYGSDPTSPVPGWQGAAARAPQKGEILDRARVEGGWTPEGPGGYARDTDSAADWRQGRAWVDLRIYRPGQTWFGSPTYRASTVTAYASPDSSYGVVTALLDQARERIDLTMYDFTLVSVAERLAAAARRGVKVRVLIEGGTLGRMYDQERYVAKVLAEAGGEVRWMLHDPANGINGRYVFNHAKYGVIDGARTFIQSENMVRHGVPADPSFGNRGWGVVVEEKGLAAYMTRVFEADWSSLYGDSLPYKPGTQLGEPPAGFQPERSVPSGRYPHPFQPLTVRSPVSVTPVLAPDHSLLETRGVIGLMRSARSTLMIEQQYAHLHWGPNNGSARTTPDIYLEEAIAAARRGVEVRILLGDAFLDPENPKDNGVTIQYVNEIASREGLNLQARLVKSDLSGLDKVHNKGVIVDQNRVLVSSINWSYNSPANNREVGLIIDSPAVGAYFTDLFTFDWYNGSPADYPLVTEVNAGAGFVEMATAGSKAVDVGGWTLDAGSGTWVLPRGTQVSPGKPLIVARDGAALGAKYGPLANLVQLPVNLNATRDTITLRRGDRAVDIVSWGEGKPGWKLPGSGGNSLCRPDGGKDTNTGLDWAGRPPTPGVAGC